MATSITTADRIHVISGLEASESSDALKLPSTASALGAVHVTGDFGAGTVTIEISLDGTTYFTLYDTKGVNIEFTSAGYAEFNTAAFYIRATADASVTSVNVAFVLKR